MKKITARQWILIVFCGGVLFGTLLANLLPKLYLPTAVELLTDLKELLQGPTAAYSGYFGYLLKVRMIPVVILWICVLGPYGTECLCIAALWYGVCAGAVLSGAVLLYGIGGLLLFLAAILPQYVFYVLIFLQLVMKQETKNRVSQTGAMQLSEEVSFLLVTAVLFLTAVLLEAYLSPIILRMAMMAV